MCPSAERRPHAKPEGAAGGGEALPGFDVLEQVIARALRQVEVWRRRAVAADAERRQLKALLQETRAAGDDPAAVARELARLREENTLALTRLAEARSRVEKIEKHLLFLEDARP